MNVKESTNRPPNFIGVSNIFLLMCRQTLNFHRCFCFAYLCPHHHYHISLSYSISYLLHFLLTIYLFIVPLHFKKKIELNFISRFKILIQIHTNKYLWVLVKKLKIIIKFIKLCVSWFFLRSHMNFTIIFSTFCFLINK